MGGLIGEASQTKDGLMSAKNMRKGLFPYNVYNYRFYKIASNDVEWQRESAVIIGTYDIQPFIISIGFYTTAPKPTVGIKSNNLYYKNYVRFFIKENSLYVLFNYSISQNTTVLIASSSGVEFINEGNNQIDQSYEEVLLE